MWGSGGRPQDSGVTGHTSGPPRTLTVPPEDTGYRATALTPRAAALGEFYQTELRVGAEACLTRGLGAGKCCSPGLAPALTPPPRIAEMAPKLPRPLPTAAGDALHRSHSRALILAMEDTGWSCVLDDCFFIHLYFRLIFLII